MIRIFVTFTFFIINILIETNYFTSKSLLIVLFNNTDHTSKSLFAFTIIVFFSDLFPEAKYETRLLKIFSLGFSFYQIIRYLHILLRENSEFLYFIKNYNTTTFDIFLDNYVLIYLLLSILFLLLCPFFWNYQHYIKHKLRMIEYKFFRFLIRLKKKLQKFLKNLEK